MKFIQLLNPFVLDNSDIHAVGSQQARAITEFPKMIAETSMRYWKPGLIFPEKGSRFLIGVAASFDLKDLRLMDLVDEYFSGDTNTTIDIFNLDDCNKVEDLHRYFPDRISGAPGNPIVGHWKDGCHVATWFGMQGRMKILETLGLEKDFLKYFGDLSSPTQRTFA